MPGLLPLALIGLLFGVSFFIGKRGEQAFVGVAAAVAAAYLIVAAVVTRRLIFPSVLIAAVGIVSAARIFRRLSGAGKGSSGDNNTVR